LIHLRSASLRSLRPRIPLLHPAVPALRSQTESWQHPHGRPVDRRSWMRAASPSLGAVFVPAKRKIVVWGTWRGLGMPCPEFQEPLDVFYKTTTNRRRTSTPPPPVSSKSSLGFQRGAGAARPPKRWHPQAASRHRSASSLQSHDIWLMTEHWMVCCFD